jgi:hypothetical protein
MAEQFIAVPGAPSRLDIRCRPARASRAALAVYRPFRWPRRAFTLVGGLVPMRLWRPRRDPEGARLASVVEDALGQRFPGLALMRSSHAGRLVVGLSEPGALLYVAKAAMGGDSGLRNEAAHLELARRRVRTPRVAATRFDDDVSVLVTEAVGLAGRVVGLAEAVATAVALQRAQVDCPPIVHGDLTAWNLLDTVEGDRLVLDWEMADARTDPWWDLLHFVASTGQLLGTWPPDRAARLLGTEAVICPLVDAGIVGRRAALAELRDCVGRQAASCGSQRRSDYLRAMRRAL